MGEAARKSHPAGVTFLVFWDSKIRKIGLADLSGTRDPTK